MSKQNQLAISKTNHNQRSQLYVQIKSKATRKQIKKYENKKKNRRTTYS